MSDIQDFDDNNIRELAFRRMSNRILDSARQKPFFQAMAHEAQKTSVLDSQATFNLLGNVLLSAIRHIALEESIDDWLMEARVLLQLLGKPNIDLRLFYRSAEEECKNEAKAAFVVIKSLEFGSDIEPLEAELEKILAQ